MTERSDLPRKLLHTAMGLVALSFRWLPFPGAVALCLAAVVLNRWIMPAVTGAVILRPGEHARGMAGGVVLYPLAVLALVVAFHDRLELAAAAWGVLAFGDGMATIVGRAAPLGRLPWNRRKTWSGLAAFTVFGAAGAAALFVWVAAGRGLNPDVGEAFAAWTPVAILAACLAAAAVAGWAESLDVGIDDNLRVAVAAGLALALAAMVSPTAVAEVPGMALALVWAMPAAGVLAGVAAAAGGVTRGGTLAGWAVATVVAVSAGVGGLVVLAAVVGLTVGTTRLGRERKRARGMVDGGGPRRASQVLANLGVAAACAVLALVAPRGGLFHVLMVAAVATAVFDTVASEIGRAWGRDTRLIPSGLRVAPGTEGGVSGEGTAAGLAGATLVAGLAGWVGLIGGVGVVAATTGAFLGSTLESWIGGRWPRAGERHNDLLNFVNTLAGAAAAYTLLEVVVPTV